MVVIDVSSSTLGFSNTIAKSLLALANDPSQRAGLVLASQSAYMALPPGDARLGAARLAADDRATSTSRTPSSPSGRSSTGRRFRIRLPATTRGSASSRAAPGSRPGSARAIQALREAGISGGQIVLVSDLRDAPEDLPRVGVILTRMRELGIELRVVTVGRSTRNPKEFSDLGGSAFIMDAAESVYAPERVQTLQDAARPRSRSFCSASCWRCCLRPSSRSCPCVGAVATG